MKNQHCTFRHSSENLSRQGMEFTLPSSLKNLMPFPQLFVQKRLQFGFNLSSHLSGFFECQTGFIIVSYHMLRHRLLAICLLVWKPFSLSIGDEFLPPASTWRRPGKRNEGWLQQCCILPANKNSTCGRCINLHDTSMGQRKNESPTGIDPMTSRTPGALYPLSYKNPWRPRLLQLSSYVTGVLYTARISTIEIIMSGDKWTKMVNFVVSNKCERWINLHDRSMGKLNMFTRNK